MDSLAELGDCALCPRDCHADRRAGRLGYCQSGSGFSVGAICAHLGEEPVLSGQRGICNVFFTRCNLQCLYCQNAQISRRRGRIVEEALSLEEVILRIERILDHGVSAVGFVSPSHCIPQMKAIITALAVRGRRPTTVMNTNAYDKVETLRSLEPLIDVYLPDLKYMDEDLALRFSDGPDYPEVATRALKEMFRQKESSLHLGADGLARSGLILRHLVLPGQVENSKRCLRFIAEELSPDVHLSLLAQYHPTPAVRSHPDLGRPLRPEEYEEVLDEAECLGFEHGWTQELASAGEYLPDFSSPDPFT